MASPLPGSSLHEPGAILTVSCYELGHQPLGVVWPRAFLERAGYAPDTLDLAVEPLDEGKVRRARLIAIAVPMYTALRAGVRAAERMRQVNPGCIIVFSGLYAVLNDDHLIGGCPDVVLGGEFEGALVGLVERIEADKTPDPGSGGRLDRLAFPVRAVARCRRSRNGPSTARDRALAADLRQQSRRSPQEGRREVNRSR